MFYLHLRSAKAFVLAAFCCIMAAQANAGIVTVTTLDDVLDGNVSSIAALNATPGGAGISLREAITAANNTAGEHAIQFGLSGTISLKAVLPSISGDGGLVIDGGTQTVVIDGGELAGTVAGLSVMSEKVEIRALTIVHFSGDGIDVRGQGCIVDSCRIGTDGTSALGNGRGIDIDTVGDALITNNLISGNDSDGIRLASSVDATIAGNYIGTNAAGNAAIPNDTGINVVFGMEVTIGGDTAGDGNLISGNSKSGIAISNNSSDVTIAANTIGLNAAGTAALGNSVGIDMDGNSAIALGSATALPNIISGNETLGVRSRNCTDVDIFNNYIGIGKTGKSAIGNGNAGVALLESESIDVGSGDTGTRNVISGNATGLLIRQSNFITVRGNYVGTNAAGDAVLPNNGPGIDLGPDGNSAAIGGPGAGEANVVSGNTGDGIVIDSGIGYDIVGNIIGLNAAGTEYLGNGGNGIKLLPTLYSVLLGGAAEGQPNTIAGNGENGVLITGGAGGVVYLTSNSIFGNGQLGIDLQGDANYNILAPVFSVGAGTIEVAPAEAGEPPYRYQLFIDDEEEGQTLIESPSSTGAYSIDVSTLEPYAGKNITATLSEDGVGTSEFSVPVALTEPVFVQHPASRQAVEGRAFTLNVQVQSPLAVTYQWLLDSGNGYVDQFVSTPTLTVGVASSVHAGKYICRVTNAAGTTDSDFALVTLVPGTVDEVVVNTLSATVDSTNMTSISNLITFPGADNFISLPEAITATNAHAGEATISFGVTGAIDLSVAMDAIAGDGGTTIEGDGITLRSDQSVSNGILVTSGGNVIDGLAVYNFFNGITFDGLDAAGNHIRNCKIGLDETALGANLNGVVISNGAHDNIVGVAPEEKGLPGGRNFISGNTGSGVLITEGSNGNVVSGNVIGLDLTLEAAHANGNGITISFGSANNVIGGVPRLDRGNVISGNGIGISLRDGGTDGSVIIGNDIGSTISGVIGNTDSGIKMSNGPANTTIGGEGAEEGNTIAGSDINGINVSGSANTLILGNEVGMAGLENEAGANLRGISVLDSTGTVIGSAAAGNVISGNIDDGIAVGAASGTVIKGNRIGLPQSPTENAGNGGAGISLDNASSTTIGGSGEGEGNIICANDGAGVESTDSSNVVIHGNWIGVDSNGVAMGNGAGGVVISSTGTGAQIGGDGAGEANIISGNNGSGITIEEAASGAVVTGNYIGVLQDGTTERPNTEAGVKVASEATNNDIGQPGQGNIIGGNGSYGVWLTTGATGNRVRGNVIGIYSEGVGAANGQGGILVDEGANANTIGEARATACSFNPASPPVSTGANTIAGNFGSGIVVSGAATINNRLRVNLIYGNLNSGISLVDSGNGGLGAPAVVLQPHPTQEIISISGPNNSLVDVYADVFSNGAGAQGRIYLATCAITTTGSVTFSSNIPAFEGSYTLSAVITTNNGAGNSSPFGGIAAPLPDNTLPVNQGGFATLTHECGATFSPPAPSFTDNSGTIADSGIDLASFNGGETGDYTITYYAEDASGNRRETDVTVTVEDTTPPQITLIGGDTITAPCFSAYADPGVTVADDCAEPGEISVTTNLLDVDPDLPGEYTVYVEANDGFNIANAQRTVTIVAGDCTDVYVSPAGSDDTGDGSLENPWQTIAFAMEKVTPFAELIADRISIHALAGTYEEKVEMVDNVRLVGEGRAVSIIAPTLAQLSTSPSVAVEGADNAVLESIGIEIPFAAPSTRIVSIVDVSMEVRDVDIFGRQVPSSIGIFVRGPGSSDTLVKDSVIRSVGIGLDIAFSAARFAFNDFQNINGEAAIKISESTGDTPVVGTLADLVNSGSNIFENVSTNFIKSDNPSDTFAQANGWENLPTEALVNQSIDGAADIAQPLFVADAKDIIAATAFVTVEDDNGSSLSGVTLSLRPTNVVLPESGTPGVYTTTMGAGRYTIRARKAGYEETVVVQDVAGGANNFTIVMGEGAEGEGEGEDTVPPIHTGDIDDDGAFNLGEVLRVVQLYNAASFSCGSGEDGFQIGAAGGQQCIPHGADYLGGEPDWRITLSELLRIVQFYSVGGYTRCTSGTEDGYCPD